MVHYDVYGPTIIATNEPVHHILDTRCIPISMPNMPGDYENPTTEKAQELKERLTAWRARMMSKALPEIERIPGLNGRLWDISKPLLQVCELIYPDRLDILRSSLLEIAGERMEEKLDTVEGQIASIIHDLSPDEIPEWTVQIPKLVEAINQTRSEDHKVTPNTLGKD
jgi:hypothetical protein